MSKVSIIVPVYNLEKVLPQTLESIMCQTHNDLEIILVNDGSKDLSGEICSEYAGKDERIILINKENGGVSSARNAGLSVASGEYVMFVDGDDLLEPETAEVMLENIAKYDSEVCICSKYFINDDPGTAAIDNVKEDVISSDFALKKQLLFGLTASLWLCLFKKDKISDIRFDESVHALEDWKFIFDALANGVDRVSICRRPLYHYIIRSGSATHSSINDRKMSCFNMTESVFDTVRKKCPQNLKIARNHNARLLVHMLVLAANCDSVEKKYNVRFKNIARSELKNALLSKYLSKRKKLYVLMTSISPKLYYFSYKTKYKLKRTL